MKNIIKSPPAFTPTTIRKTKSTPQNNLLSLLQKVDFSKLANLFLSPKSTPQMPQTVYNEKQRLTQASIQKHYKTVKTLRKN